MPFVIRIFDNRWNAKREVRQYSGSQRSANQRQCNRWTPLHVAAQNGRISEVRRLLAAEDVRIDAQSNGGMTPLMRHLRGAISKL